MIHCCGKNRAPEVSVEIESQILHQAKKTVTMVVRVYRGEIVCARVEVEVRSNWFGWRRHGRRFYVRDLDNVSCQRVVAAPRRSKPRKQDRGTYRIQRSNAGVG